MNTNTIHINCDLGEGVSKEVKIMDYIQACNIACGGHYGTTQSINNTLSKAIDHELELGAHPSYPDKELFGRVSMKMSRVDFISSMTKQLDNYFNELSKFSASNDHIKAHGALYNDLCINDELGHWFIEAIRGYSFKSIYTPFNSQLAVLAEEKGMTVRYEAFIDRNYNNSGRLVSRALPNAEKKSLEAVWNQLQSIASKAEVSTIDGNTIRLEASTFCIHGDHPMALERLKFISKQFKL